MVFTSQLYLAFVAAVFAVYWWLGTRRRQNAFLLVASYLFYGWVHPWFCALLATSTVVDYLCGIELERRFEGRRRFLVASLVTNLGMLATFKYFDFFSTSFAEVARALGFELDPITLELFLPAGISFYTFQTLSYTIDIYRGQMRATRNFVDFALFVSFFPQLIAGPIERARRFLPQIQSERVFRGERFLAAFPLLVQGYLKKTVIADNVAVYADKIFLLEQPTPTLLVAGTFAFTVQILADFSAYTDIARGTARLLGFELIENFRSPYLAISPSDFWRRWHISLSTWIRDYLYIPLGGTRVAGRLGQLRVLAISLGLSGLWHGAAWHFVAWGLYYALLISAYRAAGFGGRWTPRTRRGWVAAWALMFGFTLVGWTLFRVPSLAWLGGVLAHGVGPLEPANALVALTVVFLTSLYAAPMVVLLLLERYLPDARWAHGIFHGLALLAIVVLGPLDATGFIYFQF